MNLHAWTPDTGTHELPALHKGWPLEDQPTTELAWWHPRPSPPTVVTRPRGFFARLRGAW